MTSSRAESLDIARGFAIILVVVLHASPVKLPPVFAAANHAFGLLRMPLLMLISGYLSAMLVAAGRSLNGRIAHFAWLFGLWSLILTACNVLMSGHVAATSYFLGQFLRPTTAMWFIWLLAIASLTVTALKRVDPRLILLASATVATVAKFILLDEPVGNEGFAYDCALRHSFFFFLGFYHGSGIMAFARAQKPYFSLVCVAGLVLSRLVDSLIGWELFGLVERLIACVLAIFGCEWLSGVKLLSRPIQWVGRRTLPIYLAHTALIPIVYLVVGDTWADPTTVVLCVATSSILISLLLQKLAIRAGAPWLYALPQSFTRVSIGSNKRAQHDSEQVAIPGQIRS